LFFIHNHLSFQGDQSAFLAGSFHRSLVIFIRRAGSKSQVIDCRAWQPYAQLFEQSPFLKMRQLLKQY
jgi:hypothetical protein